MNPSLDSQSPGCVFPLLASQTRRMLQAKDGSYVWYKVYFCESPGKELWVSESGHVTLPSVNPAFSSMLSITF